MASISPDRSTQLADLAHVVLSVARDIRLYGHPSHEIIEVSELESLVMNQVHQNPGVSPTGICAAVGLRSSNTSAVLRSLEEKGMIERVPNPNDHRSVSVYVTALAASNLEKVRDMWASFLAPHLDESLALAPVIEILAKLDESVAEAADRELTRPV